MPRRIAPHGLDQHFLADLAGIEAGLAVLDDYRAGIARGLDGPEADEETVAAQMPGQLVLRDAHVAFALGDALDLRGAGLAGKLQRGFQRLAGLGIEAQRVGSAARGV